MGSLSQVVRVGIIGCGEISQVVHIPTLTFMSKWFKITYLCDVSADGLKHCAAKISNPVKTTQDFNKLCASDDVDAVLVATSDEYHALQTIAALKYNKHVLVEKPLALTKADVQSIAEAEQKSAGKVMVGYMRRYAAPFADVVKEVGGLDKIVYARVRGIIGPNSTFVSQSGTFAEKFTDFRPEDVADKSQRGLEQATAGLKECGNVPVTPETILSWRILGGLSSHDLSAVREVLGLPTGVIGSAMGFPFYNVLFKYDGFNLCYEGGIDEIPRFDAHFEVHSMTKSVRLQYDTPYVKGLPITMHITENDNGAYKETKILKSYEDPYTLEMKVFWEMVVEGKTPKTTVADAAQDLEIFGMLMKKQYDP